MESSWLYPELSELYDGFYIIANNNENLNIDFPLLTVVIMHPARHPRKENCFLGSQRCFSSVTATRNWFLAGFLRAKVGGTKSGDFKKKNLYENQPITRSISLVWHMFTFIFWYVLTITKLLISQSWWKGIGGEPLASQWFHICTLI